MDETEEERENRRSIEKARIEEYRASRTPEEIEKDREKDRLIYQNSTEEEIDIILKSRKLKYESKSFEVKEKIQKKKKEDIAKKRAFDLLSKNEKRIQKENDRLENIHNVHKKWLQNPYQEPSIED
jgi:hypothetical protein